ncbi:MAG: glycosyltransferase [Pyrinomonadaceae bacterium]|nr:glycosyltransferase [Pyrinomonadaceae bacterium]
MRTLFAFGILTWLLVVWGFSGAIAVDPFYKWVVAPILAVLTAYHLTNFGLELWFKQFDLDEHFRRVSRYWRVQHVRDVYHLVHLRQPSVDVFLPICGEDIAILRNTWKHVARLNYLNKKVYVLDDSSDDCAEHRALAERFGFTYIERPNKGEMKKAGNLKYAYERTGGEFIAIFDADFAPHPDFLLELLPYTADPKVGIVQSPQYFDVSTEAYKASPLAYAAAFQQELFYRVTQPARERLGGPICCGTNAIYRRAALETIGGPKQVDASEDSRTGYALMCQGWVVRYVPIILALGVCPDNVYAFFHQQHRWCRGRTELVLSREFLKSPVSFFPKFCVASGFLLFLTRPLTILMTFHLFWVIFVYNESISISHAVVFYPYIIFSIIMLPLFHIARMRLVVFYAGLVQLYANSHALISFFLGRSVGWIATGAKHTSVSPAFRQTMYGLGTYIAVYSLLCIVAALVGFLHPLDVNYYSVQFWLFYNLGISMVLFMQMYKFYRTAVKTSMA